MGPTHFVRLSNLIALESHHVKLIQEQNTFTDSLTDK